jgi:hypothetical protein
LDNQLGTKGEHERSTRHGQQADRWVLGDGTAGRKSVIKLELCMVWDLHDELNDDDDPGKTEVPVKPVELS